MRMNPGDDEQMNVSGECVQTGDGIRGVEADGTEPRRLWQGLWFSSE